MSAADMSERLASDNAAPLERDVAAVAGDAAAVAVEGYKSTASTDARCKAAVSTCTAAFDCIRRLTAVLTRRSEWETGYRQRGLETASRFSSSMSF